MEPSRFSQPIHIELEAHLATDLERHHAILLSSDCPILQGCHRFDCQIPGTWPALDAHYRILHPLEQHALKCDTADERYL